MVESKALKAGIWYTISNFLVKGIGFLSMPFFTRLMTQSEIGSFSNITSWFSILAIVATFEIYSSISIARFDYKGKLDEYISSCLILGSSITLGFYLIVLVFHSFFEQLFLMDFMTLNLVFIYLLVYPAIQMFQLKSQIQYKYKASAAISLINVILSTGVSLLLVLLMNNSLQGRIIGYFIPLIALALIVYIYLLKSGKRITRKYWKYAIRIAFPLIWHLLAGYLLSSSDRIMITKMISPEANALYSVSYTISMVANILWLSMNNAWSPWAYEMMDQKNYSALRKKSKPYTIFFFVIVLLLMLITPELLLIMGGSSYIEAKYVMPPVMVGYVFQFIYSLFVNIEFYHKKQRNIAIGTIIAAVINIGLNLIFIPIFGYIAAAYTTLIGYACLFIIHYLFVKKLKCDNWYDIKFFLIIIMIALLALVACNFLYIFDIVRYIAFGFLAIAGLLLVITKKDVIKSLLAKNK